MDKGRGVSTRMSEQYCELCGLQMKVQGQRKFCVNHEVSCSSLMRKVGEKLHNKLNQRRRRHQIYGKFTRDEWVQVLKWCDYKCLWCNRSYVNLTVDHILPISKGGSNFIDNIAPLCKSCNSRKHDYYMKPICIVSTRQTTLLKDLTVSS